MSVQNNKNTQLIIHNLNEKLYHDFYLYVNDIPVETKTLYKQNKCIILIDKAFEDKDTIKLTVKNKIFLENQGYKIFHCFKILVGLLGQAPNDGFLGSPFTLCAKFQYVKDMELYYQQRLDEHPFYTPSKDVVFSSYMTCDEDTFLSWKHYLIVLVNIIVLCISILLVMMVNSTAIWGAILCVFLMSNAVLYGFLCRYKKYKTLCEKDSST